MKGRVHKKGLALVLALAFAAQGLGAGRLPFRPFDSYAYTGAATVKASSLNVRSGPGTGYSSQGRLAAGASIQIVGEQQGTDGNLWYQIQYTGSGGTVNTGYVSSLYVRLPVSYSTDADFEAYLTSQGFPESYKNGLRQLHAQYPSWVFVAKNTGLDWETVIENESVLGRNLVSAASISSWKSVESGAYDWNSSTWTGLDGGSWVAASEDIIRYYMDPRNFLDETYVFQFLSHEYNPSAQTREGLASMVEGTFLSGTTSSTGTSGGGTSYGPGGSSSSASQKGPGASTSDRDAVTGPGVQGSGSTSQGAASESPGGGSASQGSSQPQSGSTSQGSGASQSGPGGSSSDVSVSLEGPQASISVKERNRVAASVMLVGPGAEDSSQPQAAQPGTEVQSPGTADTASGGTKTYVDILMDAASQSGVSPYVLAAMILQEQGKSGGTNLISGTYSGYEGYYNFFNVEAYQSGSLSPTEMGLRYASESGTSGRPWNTVEKSILGGAQNYGDNYVKAGQNTFYLKKFNVQGTNLYKHQYMSNIQGAASEAAYLAEAYTNELKSSALEFHIPVYSNMPEQASMAPTGDGSPNNKLSSLSVDGFSLTPTFSRDTESYSLIVDSSVSQVQVSAAAADQTAEVSGAGAISLASGGNDITVSVKAQNGSVRNYVIHVVKQEGGPTAGSGQTTASPAGSGASPGSSAGPGASSGPGTSGGSSSGPGGTNVTIVEID